MDIFWILIESCQCDVARFITDLCAFFLKCSRDSKVSNVFGGSSHSSVSIFADRLIPQLGGETIHDFRSSNRFNFEGCNKLPWFPAVSSWKIATTKVLSQVPSYKNEPNTRTENFGGFVKCYVSSYVVCPVFEKWWWLVNCDVVLGTVWILDMLPRQPETRHKFRGLTDLPLVTETARDLWRFVVVYPVWCDEQGWAVGKAFAKVMWAIKNPWLLGVYSALYYPVMLGFIVNHYKDTT